jgi:hypothetical protein
MVQVFAARSVTLEDLRQHFGLQLTTAFDFFPEWMEAKAELTEAEKQSLDRVKQHFLHLSQSLPLMENAIKMVVISPLLDLAGFYDQPFGLRTEASVEVASQDEEILIRGQIDVLVVLERLWVLAIESKNMGIGLSVGIPQALSYMLAAPKTDGPVFGLVTTGSEFVFLKLAQQGTPQYTSSRVFSMLSPMNELYDVLRILKALGAAISPEVESGLLG